MADISALGNLAPAEPIDMDMYNLSTGVSKPFPRKGRYTLRAPESFTAEAFGRTNAGNLSVQIDPSIVGGPSDGYKLRFIRVSAKTYKRGNDTVSQLSDYLKACGQSGRLTGDPQEAADLVEQTANLTYDAFIDWRLFARGHRADGTDWVIDGMENFPKDPKTGEHVPYVQSEVQKGDDGEPLILRANLQVKRFVAAA